MVVGFFIDVRDFVCVGGNRPKRSGGAVMVSHHTLSDRLEVLDDIRREFPIKEALAYEEKIERIIYEHIWDVLSVLQTKYEKEADLSMDEMAKNYEKQI
jgi:hypothetical protein